MTCPSSSTVSVEAAIIGTGPAGLMAAGVLAEGGVETHVFEAMPSSGRKFLLAGKGGLNLTHNEPFHDFISKYNDRLELLKPHLEKFGPNEVLTWAAGLGIETFIGTSNRIFPVGMKSLPLFRNWLGYLRDLRITFHFRHRWIGWQKDRTLIFETPDDDLNVDSRVTILALGGGSWPRTGSTGAWVSILRENGIQVKTLKPSNCGFNIPWSDHFRERYEGVPLKSVVLSFSPSNRPRFRQQGEFIITRTGIEGSLVYACSSLLREEIESHGRAIVHLDLAPDISREKIIDRLSQPRHSRTLASHLNKTIGLKDVKAGLLWEFTPKEVYAEPEIMASYIKNLPLPLLSPRPLEEAISSAGGVDFSALDGKLMLRSMPGVFCAGEMLDWDAPTGGYLITACLSTGYAAGMGALHYLRGA